MRRRRGGLSDGLTRVRTIRFKRCNSKTDTVVKLLGRGMHHEKFGVGGN